MADKKISELDQTLDLNDQADFPLSQDNGGEPTTFKAKLTQIATKIAEAITFSNLKTGNKQLVSAVNQTISNLADDFNTTAGSTYAKDDCVLYNGVLYQCINNSGTTSGTFIDADWTAIKAVDVGSGGGGGGGAGGHTIVDNAGISLPQRTNLQFNGAYSEDNSTDDTTEINVVREMTKAAFDQLTEAEKTGLINITDITGGNDDRFQPVIYSTEEREIGVWTDGKPLYEKTFTSTTIVGFNSDTEMVLNDNIPTGAEIKSIFGMLDLNLSNDHYVANSTNWFKYYFNVLTEKILASQSLASATPTSTLAVFTIQYTKSSDTAGSGQWTPQGVPAHHYSEDEQVVGTWIDGSTVYERVFDLGSDINISYDSWTETSISWQTLNVNRLVGAEGSTSSGGTFAGTLLASKKSNGNIEIQTPRNGTATGVRYLTLRYTKSST